jgi:hypothetical protein
VFLAISTLSIDKPADHECPISVFVTTKSVDSFVLLVRKENVSELKIA